MKDLHELHLCIVGLGLMGGSLALALRDSVATISAVDVDEKTLEEGLARRVIDRASTSLEHGIAGADMIVLATPVRTILAAIEQMAKTRQTKAILTDLGSTKVDVVAAMNRLPPHFEAIGAHPMCGRERSGFEAAEGDLFKGKKVVLCISDRTTALAQRTVTDLFEAAGADIVFMDPELHDRAVAVTSHLPYLLAGTLGHITAEIAVEDNEIWSLVASGFADMTRLAGSDPAMMHDILVTNRKAIIRALSLFKSHLDTLLGLLAAGDGRGLEAWQADVWRDYWDYRNR